MPRSLSKDCLGHRFPTEGRGYQCSETNQQGLVRDTRCPWVIHETPLQGIQRIENKGANSLLQTYNQTNLQIHHISCITTYHNCEQKNSVLSNLITSAKSSPLLRFLVQQNTALFSTFRPPFVLLRHRRDILTFLDILTVYTMKTIYFLNAYHLGW